MPKNNAKVFASDDSMLDNCKKGVVEIQSGFYIDDNKKFYLIDNSSGFIVSNENGNLYIVSTYKSSQVSTKKIKKYCKDNSIKINDQTRFRQFTRVVVENDVTTELNMEASSKEENFCLWSSHNVLQEKKALALEDQHPVEQNDVVYALGYDDEMSFKLNYRVEDVRAAKGNVENNKFVVGKSEYIQYSIANDKNMSGGPLISENGYVVGLADYTVKCDDSSVGNALNVNRIIVLLENYGINYNSCKLDETYKELQGIYDESKKKAESSKYRDYSKASLNKALKEAEETLKRTETTTIAKIKEQEELLKTSESELVKKNSLITIFKFIMIVPNVIVLIVLICTIVKFVKLYKELKRKKVPVNTNGMAGAFPQNNISRQNMGQQPMQQRNPQAGFNQPMQQRNSQTGFNQPMQQVNPQAGFNQPMQQRNSQTGFNQPMQQVNPQAGFNQPMQQVNPQTGFNQPMQQGNPQAGFNQPMQQGNPQPRYSQPMQQPISELVDTAPNGQQLIQFQMSGSFMQGANLPSAVLVRSKTGERFAVQPGDNIIGKSSQNADIVIGGNPAISRRHAKIGVRNGQYVLIDLGSVNGTSVNGSEIGQQEIVLKGNDMIGIADETFQFMMGM